MLRSGLRMFSRIGCSGRVFWLLVALLVVYCGVDGILGKGLLSSPKKSSVGGVGTGNVSVGSGAGCGRLVSWMGELDLIVRDLGREYGEVERRILLLEESKKDLTKSAPWEKDNMAAVLLQLELAIDAHRGDALRLSRERRELREQFASRSVVYVERCVSGGG